MSRRPTTRLVVDILERIERIGRFIADFDRESFLRDEKTCDSVVRNLEVIGLAANRLPDAFTASHPEVPWRRIVGLRNRIVHEYFDVDLELVWEIVEAELPGLKAGLRAVVRGSDDDSAGT